MSTPQPMPEPDTSPIPYIGRFAPTPSGPLHFGSLVAALASFLDARSHQGRWLVRIEDIDPPREVPGAAAGILKTLEAFELYWDGDVLFQSQRHAAYQEAVDRLLQTQKAYPCQCSRKQLRSFSVYPGYCLQNPPQAGTPCAIRMKTSGTLTIDDRVQGHCQWSMADIGDFIIQRRDHLFAYQLAVVLDDHFQGVNQVVRGFDILESTPRQLQLIHALNLRTPQYAHIPVIVQSNGQKLSKQNHAPGITAHNRELLLRQALTALKLTLPADVTTYSYSDLLGWAIQNWSFSGIQGQQQIALTEIS